MKVYEEIRHGSYSAKREITLTSDDYDTFFNEVVKTCSYTKSAQHHYESLHQAHSDLITTGRGSHGWIDWAIVKD